MSNIPPLDIDLATVEVKRFELVAKGHYDLRVDKVELTKSKTGANMAKLDFVTTTPVKSVSGADLPIGTRVFDNLMLEPTGKATWEQVQNNLAMIVQAAKFAPGTARMNNVPQWVPQLQGRTLRCVVEVEQASTNAQGQTFKAKNVITAYLK